jgi:mRNA-degrading endonuclease RelE of RelBE toxin-antitoxin system
VSYRIEPTERFQRETKRLAKKYRSIPSELRELSQELKTNPHLGTDLGAGIFKIRLAIKSKGKGKSGGGRVVTYVIDEEEIIHLLTIYDKSELDTIETSELRELVRELFGR